jgi:hypothetical protein
VGADPLVAGVVAAGAVLDVTGAELAAGAALLVLGETTLAALLGFGLTTDAAGIEAATLGAGDWALVTTLETPAGTSVVTEGEPVIGFAAEVAAALRPPEPCSVELQELTASSEQVSAEHRRTEEESAIRVDIRCGSLARGFGFGTAENAKFLEIRAV